MTSLRVATYNIRLGGRARAELRDVVRRIAPDVLLVNESPKSPLTWRRRSAWLASDWQLCYVTGGRVAGSNLVLAREGVEVESVLCLVLPQPRWSPRRGIAAAQLRVGGRPIAVVSCHLGLASDRRLREVEEVLAVADGLAGPVVVGGDLNEPAGGPCWRRLQDAGLVDHGSARWPTFPAARPAARIDALLVRGDVRVTHHGIVEAPSDLLARASDHLPVGAVLEM